MKRTVKSASDLQRLALQRGASVEIGKKRFNAGMEKVDAVARAKPEAKVEVQGPPKPEQIQAAPAPAPAAPPHTENVQINLDMAPVAAAVDRGNERVVEAIKESLRQVSVPTNSSQPTSWLFTIKRDVRGFIESVEARSTG